MSVKIVFMGTPDFAVPSLEVLVQHGYPVSAVITAPDKPAGRGLQMQSSPVKQAAERLGIPVLQPEKLKNPDFLNQLKAINADLFIVVAFRMLPEVVWAMPRLGTFNLHGSLLPKYRGAAPINWAIMNGEKETGLTTFFLQQEIDTGDIILQQKLSIGAHETARELHDRMMIAGADLVLKTVEAIDKNKVKTSPQILIDSPPAAPKIFKDICKIDWHNPAQQIHDFIRGLSPYPGAWGIIHNKTYKIYRSLPEVFGHSHEIGELITDNKTFLKIAVADGFIHIFGLQQEGKKKMGIEEFLRGNKI
ncbi:MAG: methionyl-tRNA formyltransferase [Bacteroidetes bacterium]|nr:methionyl-tRNA formyltransferase [Bacteroidota bacterium]